jgi:hypothetical protein
LGRLQFQKSPSKKLVRPYLNRTRQVCNSSNAGGIGGGSWSKAQAKKHQTLSEKITKAKRTGFVTEHLPSSMCKALSSTPVPTTKKKKQLE